MSGTALLRKSAPASVVAGLDSLVPDHSTVSRRGDGQQYRQCACPGSAAAPDSCKRAHCQRQWRWRLRHEGLPRSHRPARRRCHHPDPQKRQALEDQPLRCRGTQRDLVRDAQAGTGDLEKWSGYHRRSLVETKMRCFKLLGERVMARDFNRQVAELQVRAAG